MGLVYFPSALMQSHNAAHSGTWGRNVGLGWAARPSWSWDLGCAALHPELRFGVCCTPHLELGLLPLPSPTVGVKNPHRHMLKSLNTTANAGLGGSVYGMIIFQGEKREGAAPNFQRGSCFQISGIQPGSPSIAAIPTPGFEPAARSGTEESPGSRLPWLLGHHLEQVRSQRQCREPRGLCRLGHLQSDSQLLSDPTGCCWAGREQ